MATIYRGYSINRNADGLFDITKDGKLIAMVSSEDVALSYVDQMRREAAKKTQAAQ